MVDFKVTFSIELPIFLCKDPQWLGTFAVRDLKGVGATI